MTTPQNWDTSYAADAQPPPWDIGRPQPAFERLAAGGRLTGRLLDAGCGTGEHVLLAAAHGADAIGVDISPRAIARARAKAAQRAVRASFEVADVLELHPLGLTFDTVIDSGVFHVFDDADRGRYVASLASVLRPGGYCYLACFSDRQPGEWGPRRVSQGELRAAFSDGWSVTSIEGDTFDINPGLPAPAVHAWLASLQRTLPHLATLHLVTLAGVGGQPRAWLGVRRRALATNRSEGSDAYGGPATRESSPLAASETNCMIM